MSNISRRFPLLLAPVSSLFWWLSYPGGGEFWPLTFVMLVPLIVSIYYCTNIRQALLCGLVAGIVHYTLLLYWILNVLGQYGGLPWFAAYPVFLFLVFCMAFYLSIFCVIAYLVVRVWRMSVAIWLLPCGWVGVDWLRSILFTGFPWMDSGYALWQQEKLIQIADLVGHHGLSFILVMVNVLVAQLFLNRTWQQKTVAAVTPAVLVSLLVGYSSVRIKLVANELNHAEHVRVGVVQGNIGQEMKWSKDKVYSTLSGYTTQSVSLIKKEKPSLLVWPETALPFYPKYHPAADVVRDFVRDNQIPLLTGSPWFVPLKKNDLKNGQYYNAALLIDPNGEVTSTYYKSHLVPFGEYVPFADLLFFIKPLVEAVGRFSSGEIDRPLTSGVAEVGVLICFESIFPDISRRWVDAGANVLANLTNDAWYGFSSAPHHSLAMTVLRAVETRRTIIRSANTGFSGFIDPLGRLSHQSPLFQPWAMSEEVALFNQKTMYVRFGYFFGPLCFFLVSAAVAAAFSRRKRTDQQI